MNNNRPGQYQTPLPPPQVGQYGSQQYQQQQPPPQPPQQYQPQAPGSYGPPQVGQYGSQQYMQQQQQQPSPPPQQPSPPPQQYQPQAPGSYGQPGNYGNYQQPPQQYQQAGNYQQQPQAPGSYGQPGNYGNYQQPPPQQYQQAGNYQQPPPPQYQQAGAYPQYGMAPQQQRPPAPTTVGGGVSLVKFFSDVRNRYARDYTLIIDKSGSMSGSLWRQAESAVAKIAPFACAADPDGICVYFFSSPTSKHPKYDNIRDANMVMGLFAREKASGTTDLYGVLNQAIDDHFKKGGKPETMLVITDGIPNSESDVKKLIVKTTKKLQRDEDLSISFIQIGSDRSASKFLQKLDDDLTKEGAKFDIVDTLSADQMKSMSFEQLIDKSIMD